MRLRIKLLIILYITTQELDTLTVEKFAARLKQADLVNKTDFDNKLTSWDRAITSNKTNYLEVQKKLNCLITKDYNLFLRRMMDLKVYLFINQHLICES